MTGPERHSRPASWAEVLYVAILKLYPESFRARYGSQMRQAFRDASRAAAPRGYAGVCVVRLRMIVELLAKAPRYYETLLGRLDEHTHTITGARPRAAGVNHVPGHFVTYVSGCSRS